MAEPRTEIDRRLDRIEEAIGTLTQLEIEANLNRIEKAIRTVAYNLVQQSHITGAQYERIDNILEGRDYADK
jgi:hypothetical protein